MSNFFDSEIVKKELVEINKLQEQVYSRAFGYPFMSREDKVEHIDKLVTLLEKQKVMYTRLSLSDSPEAKKMTQTLQKSISSMGFPPGTDMQILFSSMNETIQTLKQNIN
jgi:hypothetical protein|tara:strand:- start:561 stop:890 length:330 start_codon:yes stop_codon:yes gene_type:complete